MDGFSNEIFKVFSEDLVPRLKCLYNHILHTKSLPKIWNGAKVVLIPKPHKYFKKVVSYR